MRQVKPFITRKIGKHVYERRAWDTHKKVVKNAAKNFRKEGYLAQCVPLGNKAKYGYGLYVTPWKRRK